MLLLAETVQPLEGRRSLEGGTYLRPNPYKRKYGVVVVILYLFSVKNQLHRLYISTYDKVSQQSWIYLHRDQTKLSMSKSMVNPLMLGGDYGPYTQK